MLFFLLGACLEEPPPLYPLDEVYTTELLGKEGHLSETIEPLGIGLAFVRVQEEGAHITAWWEKTTTTGPVSFSDGHDPSELGRYTLRLEFEGLISPYEGQSDFIVVYPTGMLEDFQPRRPMPVYSEDGEEWEWGARQTGVSWAIEDPTFLDSDAVNTDESEMHQVPFHLYAEQKTLRLSSLNPPP